MNMTIEPTLGPQVVKPRIDLHGKVFGWWTVLHRGPDFTRSRMAGWICRCSCGKISRVRHQKLIRGESKSCGCFAVKTATIHGMWNRDEYGIWHSMIRRCTNPSHEAYGRYGGRGITVCQRWLESPRNFLDDMGPRPSKRHSVERINNDGNYDKTNCRWATMKEQLRNTCVNHLLELNGVTKTMIEWAEVTGLKYTTIKERIVRGWPVDKALSMPPLSHGFRSGLFGKMNGLK